MFQTDVTKKNSVQIDLTKTTEADIYARPVYYYNTKDPEGENETGVSVYEIQRNTSPYAAGQPIVSVNIKLDGVMDYHSVERKKYTTAIIEIGGIQAFYLFLGFFVCGYFTEIEFQANLVKELFLEK